MRSRRVKGRKETEIMPSGGKYFDETPVKSLSKELERKASFSEIARCFYCGLCYFSSDLKPAGLVKEREVMVNWVLLTF